MGDSSDSFEPVGPTTYQENTAVKPNTTTFFQKIKNVGKTVRQNVGQIFNQKNTSTSERYDEQPDINTESKNTESPNKESKNTESKNTESIEPAIIQSIKNMKNLLIFNKLSIGLTSLLSSLFITLDYSFAF